MNIAFLIDKSQTFQMISEILIESNKRDYSSTVYSFCNKDVLNFDDLSDYKNITFKKFSSLDSLIDCHKSERDRFDASIGINFFNKKWHKFYENDQQANFAVEYCWNELYKAHNDSPGDSTLFCNTSWTQEKIKEIRHHQNTVCLGSSWFEFIKRFKSNQKQDYAVFMAPHNQYFLRYPEFNDKFLKAVELIRAQCTSMGLRLILKSRRKFSRNYESLDVFDSAVYDDSAFSHLKLFSNSAVVFNFCSSAINELAFVETPSVCIFPDLHVSLRDYEKDTFKAMKLINKKYYSDIFDDAHCTGITMLDLNKDTVGEKIKNIICAKNNWKNFQHSHFSGDHSGSASRILDYIGEKT